MFDDLMNEILEELIIELGIDTSNEGDVNILKIKLKNAIREIKQSVGYRDTHTEEFILADMQNYIGNIKDLTMYDYALVGAEGETNHSENGTARTWKSRKSCFNGIVRFADV